MSDQEVSPELMTLFPLRSAHKGESLVTREKSTQKDSSNYNNKKQEGKRGQAIKITIEY